MRHLPARPRQSSWIPTFLIACCITSALPASPPAPRYASRIWRTEDGLPENRIRALAQTPDGYLWIATSSGLARFDGVRFVVHTRLSTPSMVDDNIRDLAVARDGSLWVATEGGGILHLNGGRFESFGQKEGLAN